MVKLDGTLFYITEYDLLDKLFESFAMKYKLPFRTIKETFIDCDNENGFYFALEDDCLLKFVDNRGEEPKVIDTWDDSDLINGFLGFANLVPFVTNI